MGGVARAAADAEDEEPPATLPDGEQAVRQRVELLGVEGARELARGDEVVGAVIA